MPKLRHIHIYIIITFLSLVSFFIALDAHSAEKKPYIVPFVETSVKIDAVLDEDVWKKAVKIDANIEVRPGENIESPVKTEVLMAYDETHIYVAFNAFDPNPSQIRAHLCDRDDIWNDDWVLILFDTFNDRRQSYDFFCNPYGIQADEIESSEGGGQWDAIWESEGRITDEGYIVEMAIPFNVLRFQPGGTDQVWSFDAVRSYPRNVRHHIGAFTRDRNNNCYLCQAEKLIGFADAIPGKNVELDPTFSVGYSQERENETSEPLVEKDKQFDPGLTARWGLTTNTTLNVALNPDFSQVEADAAQMDINRKFP
ncbi:MAG: carbohydrate binding family 9 domain-containing protein, partial [Candidatus Latescibacteria bacterium]|nr:carbohydrate binding family 9 domain-containing protein [Candidatus Latescibacterota bacterium]